METEEITVVDWQMFPQLKLECKKEPVIELVPALPGYLKTEPQEITEGEVSPRSASPAAVSDCDVAPAAQDVFYRGGDSNSPNEASASVSVPALPTEAKAVEEVILIDSDDDGGGDASEASYDNEADSRLTGVNDWNAVPPVMTEGNLLNPMLKMEAEASARVSSPAAASDRVAQPPPSVPWTGDSSNSSPTPSTRTADKPVVEVFLVDSDDGEMAEAATNNSSNVAHGQFPYEHPRRPNGKFSPAQSARLKSEYAISRFVDATRRSRLARELALSEASVKNWFKYRRATERRAKGRFSSTDRGSNSTNSSTPQVHLASWQDSTNSSPVPGAFTAEKSLSGVYPSDLEYEDTRDAVTDSSSRVKMEAEAYARVSSPAAASDRVAQPPPSAPRTGGSSNFSPTLSARTADKPVVEVFLVDSDDEQTPEAATNNSSNGISSSFTSRSVAGAVAVARGQRPYGLPRAPRTVFTPEQLARLTSEYAGSRYLDSERRSRLVRELALSEQQIKVWFQNRRADDRQAEEHYSGEQLMKLEAEYAKGSDVFERRIRAVAEALDMSQRRVRRWFHGRLDRDGRFERAGADTCRSSTDSGSKSTNTLTSQVNSPSWQVSAATPRAVPVSGGVPTAPCAQPTHRAASNKSSSVTRGSQPEGRPGRRRTVFSPEQMERLNSEYVSGHYLSGERRSQLARELGLPESCIQYWFQNRRAEDKRAESEDADRRHSSRDSGSNSTNSLRSQVHPARQKDSTKSSPSRSAATAEKAVFQTESEDEDMRESFTHSSNKVKMEAEASARESSPAAASDSVVPSATNVTREGDRPAERSVSEVLTEPNEEDSPKAVTRKRSTGDDLLFLFFC